jgi:hypothetical protein
MTKREKTMPTKPKAHKLLVLQDTTLTAMASQPRFTKQFPWLSSLSDAPKKKRGSCCGSNNGRRAVVFTAAKQRIAGMGAAQKNKMKQLLNTEKIRIVYRVGRKVQQLTF